VHTGLGEVRKVELEQAGGQEYRVKGLELDPGRSSQIPQEELSSKPLLSLSKGDVLQPLEGEALLKSLICCIWKSRTPAE
jgi:hypothetical protein